MELSLNEVESLAVKAARGAGFSWGLADDIGRGARALASEGADWSASLLALLARAGAFDPPSARRSALWLSGEPDMRGQTPLCPVRTAAFVNDAPPDIGEGALRLLNVGLPIWLHALLRTQGLWRVETDLGAAAADAALRRGGEAAPAAVSRATLAPRDFDALNAYAARIYVPESDRSRARGAGGGRVDDE
jgi:hypothetical protein